MDFRQLKYFTRVYEERNLSKAAQSCNVSQSAVSFQIAKLEEYVGSPLFVRKRSGMVPTAQGEHLYRQAIPLLRAFASVKETIRRRGGELSGNFALGLTYSVLKTIGPEFLRTLHEDYPAIKLALTESVPSSALASMLQREIELGMTFNPPQHPDLISKPVLREDLVLIGRADIIGTPGVPIEVEDMLSKPLMTFHGSSALDSPLQRQIVTSARARMNSRQAIGFALKQGYGCVVGSKVFSREVRQSGEVAMRPIVGNPLRRTLAVSVHADSPASYVAEEIQNLLIKLIEGAVSSGVWEAEFIWEQP